MYQYKTAVADYEGMQEVLTTNGAEGWRLVSVTPDTYRMTPSTPGGEDSLRIGTVAIEELPGGQGTREYSASYYLLVFERQDDPSSVRTLEAASESIEFPHHFALPEY